MKQRKTTKLFCIIMLIFMLSFIVIARNDNYKTSQEADPSNEESSTESTESSSEDTNEENEEASRAEASTESSEESEEPKGISERIADLFIKQKKRQEASKDEGDLWGMFSNLISKDDETLLSGTIEALENSHTKITQEDIDKAKEIIEKSDVGFETGGSTGSSEGTTEEETKTEESNLKTPEQLCPEKEEEYVDFNKSKLLNSIEDVDDSSPSKEESEPNKKLIAQWCAFQKLEGEEKNNAWKGMNTEKRKKMLQGVGGEYGTTISGLEEGTWDGNNIVIGDNKINLDLEGYYSSENEASPFEFRGESDWKYQRKAIRKISAEENNVKITLGDEKNGKSTVSINGENVEFDPQTMKITSDGKEYDWNGQGNLDYDSENSKIKLEFAQGSKESDITNFPILKTPSGEEVSPFQVKAKDQTLPEGVKKPSSGYKVIQGGKYTVDSKGVKREIKSAEVKLDEKGSVKSVKDSYINKKELDGDLYAVGEFNLQKTESGNFFDLSSGVLTINANDNSRLYYWQNSDLKKLDVKGKGEVYIRNGDKVLQMKAGKLSYKVIPEDMQDNSGKFKHTIQEIVNPADPEKPFRLKKDKESGEITLTDSTGKKVDKEGKTQGGESGSGEGEGEGESDIGKGMQENSKGSVTLKSRTYVDAIGEFKDGVATTSDVRVNGIEKLPEGLSQNEFINQFGKNQDLSLTLNLKIHTDEIDGEKVMEMLKDSDLSSNSDLYKAIEGEVGNMGSLKGKSVNFKLKGTEPSANFAGKSISLTDNAKNEINSLVSTMVSKKPEVIQIPPILPRTPPLADIIPQYPDGSPLTESGGSRLYKYYKSLN